jgi:type IV secretion system protein VirB5
MTTWKKVLMALWVVGCGVPAAQAQFAVIDVASVTQLISQLNTLEQQLATAKEDLTQARTAYQSTVGGRGMELLLSGAVRNYLPGTWNGIQTAFQPGGGSYSVLSSDLGMALQSNAVLSRQVIAGVAPAVQQQLQSQREAVALLQAVSHEELATTSSRFATLQQLINAIGSASDQKSVLDLQARIGAEGVMLQNEQAKLQVLYQGVLAQQWATEQQGRELAVANHGQFASRFRPIP